jgi:hypothetical protein
LTGLSTALQRREADLNAMARKMQSTTGPSDRADEDERPRKRDDMDPTQKRLQFWSR